MSTSPIENASFTFPHSLFVINMTEKIKQKIVTSLLKEYYLFFRSEKIDISEENLLTLLNTSFNNAVASFNKLKSPKICNNLETYVKFWLREELQIYYQTKSLIKINSKNPLDKKDEFLEVVKKFLFLLPKEDLASLQRKLFWESSFEKRQKIYKRYQPLLNKLKNPFAEMISSRNTFAQKQDYTNFIDLKIQKDKISLNEYKYFLKNINKVIKYLNSQLPEVKNLPNWFYDPLNQPCLLCKIPLKDLETPEDTIIFVTKLYPQIKPFIPKIHLFFGEGANMRYLKEQDIFSVNIRKNVNKRHQMLDLIHELGHVVYLIDGFAHHEDLLSYGHYVFEKEALKIVLKILNSLSPQLLRAYYLDLLLILHRSLFELAIYQKPKQDYDLLYAQLFNQCVTGATQKNNSLYLLDERIIFRPLSSLKTAVAIGNLFG